jgi:hypothetical protein
MKSRLLYNENGLVSQENFKPCATTITARFSITLPAHQAEVFIFCRKDTPDVAPLTIHAGRAEYSADAPPGRYGYWLHCPIDGAALPVGDNTVTVPAQPDWDVAVEAASEQPLIRLRVADGTSTDEEVLPEYGDPAIVEDRDAWLALLPESLRTLTDRWEWCWNLAGFLSSAWTYANEEDGVSYAPWDARTILKWGRAQRDDSGRKPIVMCCHYSICFVQFCMAMGVPARVVVLTPGIGRTDGHFVAEVWLEEFQSWAMMDTNMHLCYKDRATQRPLAVAELPGRGAELRDMAQFGSGWETQRTRFQQIVENDYLSGAVYRLWGVWQRHNWVERPDLVPPAHGAVTYCETDIIWCADDEATSAELAMFPHLLSSQKLSDEPV